MALGAGSLGFLAVIGTAYLFFKIRQNRKETAVVDYPAYGVVGPKNQKTEASPDEKMTRSTQILTFQRQKQKQEPIQVDKAPVRPTALSLKPDPEEEEEDENDFIVYECSGLAPAGEMVVKNPMFDSADDPQSPVKVAAPRAK